MNRLSVLLGAVVLGFSPGVANATSTALLLGGKGEYAELTPEQMETAFGGYFAGYDARVSVPFPGDADFGTAIAVGADNLYAAVYSTPGVKTIGGVSKGAPSVTQVLIRLMEDAADPADGKVPPPPSELNVAVYGSPSERYYGEGVTYQPIPDTPYDVLIVTAEYDGIADFPDNPFNLLAVLNATLGADQLHVASAYHDIRNEPTKYTIVENTLGGTTTTILIPTPVLPLLEPMLDKGASPAVVARLDKLLRPVIDKAYRRPAWTVGIPATLTGPPSGTSTAAAPAAQLADTATATAARTGTGKHRSRHTRPLISERPEAGPSTDDSGDARARRSARSRADDDDDAKAALRASKSVVRLKQPFRHRQHELSRRHPIAGRQNDVAQP